LGFRALRRGGGLGKNGRRRPQQTTQESFHPAKLRPGQPPDEFRWVGGGAVWPRGRKHQPLPLKATFSKTVRLSKRVGK
jgi:hypothetical protein